MSNRINISSGTEWEDKVGYSRAVKIGNILEIAGTVAVDSSGEIVGRNNPYEQSKFILSKIEKILIEAGFTLKDVIRTRIYITNIHDWQDVTKAHGEVFKNIKPACTLLEVSNLISKDYLVEIEASAIK